MQWFSGKSLQAFAIDCVRGKVEEETGDGYNSEYSIVVNRLETDAILS